ncbi:glycoside hydrolase family 172 protein [Flavobacterium granuli]|uniref:DUF2961 domain-containing protein n=1 Tax=Flavobacterium granuli TaxID=280093 RepID=A0A1M5JT76_9FLAO|nr:glycoside hydrolase family 172 protein [Flavobacterium granuli]PRZ26052.1 Protein of unknown function (DUF2961) [Flavobacterium granuli]SHG43751.1 Protein of unknown function [Flavobacterium granuli]
MKKSYFLLLPILLVVLMSFKMLVGNKIISIDSLLNEMVDRDNLARFPEQNYTCAQFSSYDRATVSPEKEGWFANWDRSMFIRTEQHGDRKEYVMMDSNGPGSIVRFWMTFAGKDCGKGILRIYIDNDTIPAIEGGAMDILSGEKIANSPLATSVSTLTKYEMRGHNLYFPIPYAKHCKVTYQSDNITDAGAKKGEAVYYNINYRTYEKGSEIISYSSEQKNKAQTARNATENKLAQLNKTISVPTEKHKIVGKIKPNDKLSISFNGSKAIRKISIKLAAKNLEQALRSTVLNITYDDIENKKASTSVWCPVGDFFGTGYQIREINTWYTEVSKDGLLSAWWVMPFEKNCTLSLTNLGDQIVEVSEGEIEVGSWKWDESSMYFGAYWKEFHHLKTGEMKNNSGLAGSPFDINYVTLSGKGVYVGDAVTLFNTVYAWWGEGDEKIYVDGEKFPSHIGTGTEDYYGYAWCRPEKIINHPFIAQPDGSGNFVPGYTVNSRYRSLDAIPFKTSFKFDMEMWHWTRATINFAPVCFYYLRGSKDPNSNPDIEGAKGAVAIKRTDIISPEVEYDNANKPTSIQAESMIFEKASGGDFAYDNSEKYGWADNMEANWSSAKKGDKLSFGFVSNTKATLQTNAVFTIRNNSGKFRFTLNNKKVILDLAGEKTMLRTIDLGFVKLNKGKNKILVEVIDVPPSKTNTVEFGFDQLLFGNKIK